ncbi:MAG: hypothetical protein HQL56_07340 [Magnetococcales bacterium]|nr:hypothetical protein [Magnetococcales bacterium]
MNQSITFDYGPFALVIFAAISLFVAWLLIVHFILRPRARQRRYAKLNAMYPPYLLPPLECNSRRKPDPEHRQYQVNLEMLTCTCSRFRNHRAYFPAQDIRRLCRHLRKELENADLLPRLDDLTRRIIQDRVRDKCYLSLSTGESRFAIGINPGSHFVRVFTRRKLDIDPPEGPFTGAYDKFVFNAGQENWIYGEAPPQSDKIIALIQEAMRSHSQGHHREASLD